MAGLAARSPAAGGVARAGASTAEGCSLFLSRTLRIRASSPGGACSGASTSPSAIAVATISVRLWAPSLPLMLATCTEAVFLLMKSASPIWPLERPAATRRRTSISRGLNASLVALRFSGRAAGTATGSVTFWPQAILPSPSTDAGYRENESDLGRVPMARHPLSPTLVLNGSHLGRWKGRGTRDGL